MSDSQDKTPPLSADSPAPMQTLPTQHGSRPSAPLEIPETRIPSTAETLPAAVTVGQTMAGYVIEDELGRGGMGVVYRARQPGLNRVVALKMILHADHASDEDRLRFLREAEALARLRHENIVQIYEVGEHDGKPFISLEYVEGGNLERHLKGTPLPPLEAARLVRQLADGVQAAHEAGIIHRDLKPANVLLQWAKGEGQRAHEEMREGSSLSPGFGTSCFPKITDFGLAKYQDQGGLSLSGAVMGTPSYMAPEQAAGKGRAVREQADVYALGAILYECLTGRPPFRAATAVDTMMQVMNDEPVSVRTLQPGTPQDIETICLKCLQKDPGRRYASARELGDELQRFLRGEPVRARPVGRIERGWRWCRRNPALAGALGAVLIVFAAGAAASTTFAIRANQARGEVEQEAEKARQSAAEEKAARKELQKTLARSLLRPLAVRANPHAGPTALSDPEIESLWELATAEDEVPVLFVREALRGPVTERQLTYRSEYALRAAVGLDSGRRDRVEQLLVERLRMKTSTFEERHRVAMALARFGTRNPLALGQIIDILTQNVGTTDGQVSREQADALAGLCARMGPREADALAAALVDALCSGSGDSARAHLAGCLETVTARLAPQEADRIYVRLAAALVGAIRGTPTNTLGMGHLGEVVEATSPRLGAKEANAVAAALTPALRETTVDAIVGVLSRGLKMLSSGLGPKEAADAHDALVAVMNQATDGFELRDLASALSAVSLRLGPKETVKTVGALLAAINKTSDAATLAVLAEQLALVSMRLDPKEATLPRVKTADALVAALSKTTDRSGVQALAQALEVIRARLGPEEAATSRDKLVNDLLVAVSKATEAKGLPSLVGRLGATSRDLGPKEAGKVADAYASALSQRL